jgi:hypothetical protein
MKRRQDRLAGDAGEVTQERLRRRGAGQPAEVLSLEWDTRALDVFRKKYGEIKFSEMQRVLADETEKFLWERGDKGPAEVRETTGVLVVLRGSRDEVLRAGQDLAARLNTLAGTFYTADDWARGHVPRPTQRPGRAAAAPLLHSEDRGLTAPGIRPAIFVI